MVYCFGLIFLDEGLADLLLICLIDITESLSDLLKLMLIWILLRDFLSWRFFDMLHNLLFGWFFDNYGFRFFFLFG